MVNLFDIINTNFFSVLSGRNRVSNFLLITEVSNFFGSQITVDRKKLIDYIAEQIKIMHIEDIGDDINQEESYEILETTNQYNQKANVFITFLEKRGWLDKDRNQDFIDIVSRTDAFLEIFDSLMKLIQEETNAKEQSTSLLSLYRNIKDFDYKNATSSIESIEIACKDLEKSILSINSKIKRFVNKVMSDLTLDEKEILMKLTIDYQKLSAYISFHNLYTKNNPNKYSISIIKKINYLQTDEVMKQTIKDYCITKGLNYENELEKNKAKKYIEQVYEKVLSQIETIEASISSISARNLSYTSSSVDRVNFRLNNERDIKGDINNLLKTIKNSNIDDEFENDFEFHSFRQIDSKSLFTARALSKIAPKETPFIKHEIKKEALIKAEELIKQREMYSIQSINNFVLNELKGKNKILADELQIKNVEDFIKMLLIPVYSTNSDSNYSVKKLKNKTFDCLNYIVDDYEIIKRKENLNDKK